MRDVVRLQRQVGNQVVQRLIGADAGRGFGAAQTGLLIQRQWNFSQANSKAEFVRRTDEDNSLFLELVQLTKRTAGPYAVIDVDAVAHSAYATLGRAMRDAFPGAPTAVVQKAKKAYYDIEKAEPEEIRVPFEDTRGKNENVHANAG